jgi:hypothetical protein
MPGVNRAPRAALFGFLRGSQRDIQAIQTQPGGILVGSGVPTAQAGMAGWYYFRTDTPGTVGQRIYACTVGGAGGHATWVATAA